MSIESTLQHIPLKFVDDDFSWRSLIVSPSSRGRERGGADQWEGPVGGAWEGPLPRRGEWSSSSGRFRTSVVRSTRRLSEPCVKWCPSDGVGYCAAAVKFHRSSAGVCVSESQISGFGGLRFWLWFLTEIHLQLLCHSPSGTSWNCKVRPLT